MTFKFLDIPVRISPAFWLFIIFFTRIYENPSIEKIILGVIFALSLLVHEYGHALTARYFGARPEIYLEAFGGYAAHYGRVTSWQDFWITVNGPLFESLLILQAYLILKSGMFQNDYINYFLYITMRLNIIWCLLNLIPVKPLDGGQIVRILLGERASTLIGMGAVIVMAPWLYYQGFLFFSVLLLIFGFQNFQQWQESKTR